jgi:hypothetical protein
VTPQDARTIIESHGADPARWPADARAALLALAHDETVAAALAEAQALDAVLADWADADVPAQIDLDAITALPQQPAQRPARRAFPAMAAAAVAAMIATGAWLGLGAELSPTAPSSAPPLAAVAAADEGELAFGYVFTPTAAEEDLI